MNYLIIAFVLLSLIGSVMWVKPTKRDRFLAALRMEAKRLGFQVQLLRLTYPREKGQVEPRKIPTIAYRLLRGKIAQQELNDWKSWRIIKCETNACEGLASGWGWVVGERTLSADLLTQLNGLLGQLPKDVIGLESTPIHMSAYWGEQVEDDMLIIQQQLMEFIRCKL